jgi:diguanylate cyclase (GGDEF)-like protein
MRPDRPATPSHALGTPHARAARRMAHTTSSMSLRSAALGATLALGAPLGWLTYRTFHGDEPMHQLLAAPELFAYLLVGPLVVFTTFGFILGRRDDRLLSFQRKLSRRNAELTRLAWRDGLTGLLNHRAFEGRIREEVARADRAREQLALIALDLDHFKRVNDTWGHPTGDEVLEHIARIVQSHARAGDGCFRTGGEEMAVLCPGADAESARAIAERIRVSVACHPLYTADGPVVVTVSAGVAVRRTAEDVNAWVRRADDALYRAKETGRNRVVTDGSGDSPPVHPEPGT